MRLKPTAAYYRADTAFAQGDHVDRKHHWEQVYRDKSPLEVSWYQAEPSLSLGLIERALDGQHGAPIIDVGGGASLLVDRLVGAGYRAVAVLDLATSALAHARDRLGPAAHQVEWFEADVTAFTPPHPFALWHDRAVFHFLTDTRDQTRYRDVLLGTVPPGGHAIIAAFGIGGPERCSGLPIVQYDAGKLRRVLGPGFELREQHREVHTTPAGKEQLFGYFLFTRVA